MKRNFTFAVISSLADSRYVRHAAKDLHVESETEKMGDNLAKTRIFMNGTSDEAWNVRNAIAGMNAVTFTECPILSVR